MLFENNNPPIAIRDIPLQVYNRALACYGAPVADSIEEAKAALMSQEWDYDSPGADTKGFSPLVFAIAEYINREGFEQEETP